MSTSSKHVSSNTFDEIFHAHPAAILFVSADHVIRILSVTNSELLRANIPRLDGFLSFEQFYLSWHLHF